MPVHSGELHLGLTALRDMHPRLAQMTAAKKAVTRKEIIRWDDEWSACTYYLWGPQTKLNYTVSEEFQIIRKMPSDIVAGYLTLRRANTQLQ